MVSKPIELYDHRGNRVKPTQRRTSRGGGNQLIPSARQTSDRKYIPLLDHDVHRNVSDLGRRTLLSLGRNIYMSSGAIRGAIEDNTTLAAQSLLPEYRGENVEWKTLLENTLWKHDRTCDVAGWPYNMRTYRKLLARAQYVDGDMGTVCVLGENDQPYLQTIPAHRIWSQDEIVKGGQWDGARIVDGVIVDDNNRALAYSVETGDGEFTYIPADSMFLSFVPIFPGQVRGFSLLGLSAWDVQDHGEAKRWELLAQKAGAGRVFQEWNEDGEAPIGSDHIDGPDSGDTTSKTPSGLWRETIDGGINSYFKSDSGGKIEAVKFDRPSANQQAFTHQVMREYFAGSGLSLDFNLDLSKLGGASLRMLVEKVNRNVTEIIDLVLEPAVRRFDAFRISAFMSPEVGVLPFQEDWHNIEYQGPGQLTADKKYELEVSRGEVELGIVSRAAVAAKRQGEGLVDVRTTNEAELDDLLTRAKRISQKHGVSLDFALQRLEKGEAGASGGAPVN